MNRKTSKVFTSDIAPSFAGPLCSAKGFNGGKLAAEAKVETVGTPTALALSPDRATVKADGEDASLLTFSVLDAHGRVAPTATNLVHFTLEGPGRLLGVGNGDPSCHEPDTFIPSWPTHARSVTGWKWTRIPDPYKSELPEVAKDFNDSAWTAGNVEADTGPLGPMENAVFRCELTVTEPDLAAEVVELDFGRIDEDGWVYINGQKVGESHDWAASPSFNVKRFLHAGPNRLAVVVANYSGPGGVNLGVKLQMRGAAIYPPWQRSAFNGLGQVIVQTSKTPGQLKLTASGDGLTPATIVLQSEPCAPRPAIP